MALERWADDVDAEDLVEANTAALRAIAELAEQRDDIDTALLGAIRDARDADRSWSEIGAMLGVSKQAAQRKYASKILASHPSRCGSPNARAFRIAFLRRSRRWSQVSRTRRIPSHRSDESVGDPARSRLIRTEAHHPDAWRMS